MSNFHGQSLPAENAWLCLAGYRLQRILSTDLVYAELEPLDDGASPTRLTAPLARAPTKARKAPDAPMIKLPHLLSRTLSARPLTACAR